MEAVSVTAFVFNTNEVYEGILLVKMYCGGSCVRSIFPGNFDIQSGLMKHLCQLFKIDYRNRSALSEEQEMNWTRK